MLPISASGSTASTSVRAHTPNGAAAAGPSPDQSVAAPVLKRLDVGTFVTEYRKQLTDAGNPPDVIEAMVNHQQRMFTDFDYFNQWNSATPEEQRQMIFGSSSAGAYRSAFPTVNSAGLAVTA